MNIDIDRLQAEIDALAEISSSEAPAVTRILFSDEDLRARSWLWEKFSEAGLAVRQDAIGNLFARWEGANPALPAVATGSHTDAVPNAGRYDGVLGVLGALEAIRTLKAAGHRPIRSIEIIAFPSEEPTRFGLGCLGSRLLAGNMDGAVANCLRDSEGRSLDKLRAYANCVGDLDSVRVSPGHYAAFLELHIEQGPILEHEGIAVGAVERISAPAAFRVFIQGEGGHAGGVLMPNRHDASLAGAELALAVERAVLDSGSPNAVGTTGVFRIEPGAINSVPSKATLEIDLRDAEVETRNRTENQIRQAAEEIAARREVKISIEIINSDQPATCDPHLVSTIIEAAKANHCNVKRMISRAYHDAVFMAQICPAAMIFIPCRNGWSHHPDEFASKESIEKGVSVLATALKELTNS